jgi:hypothetical protein
MFRPQPVAFREKSAQDYFRFRASSHLVPSQCQTTYLAILNRILHHWVMINVRRKSYRLKETPRAGLLSDRIVSQKSSGISSGGLGPYRCRAASILRDG